MVKIGAMSICLQPLLASEEPTGARLLHAAAEVGVDGVEFYATHWGADPRDANGAAALKRLGAELGVEIFAVGSGTRLGYGDARREQAMATLKNQIRAAAAVGADGLIIEVHPNPDEAKSDGAQSLTFENFANLMAEVTAIRASVAKVKV